jgi:hypothetical protein
MNLTQGIKLTFTEILKKHVRYSKRRRQKLLFQELKEAEII